MAPILFMQARELSTHNKVLMMLVMKAQVLLLRMSR
jgi:hypothetical protein